MRGVPLGSVLGLFLFSCYTSPVADISESFDVLRHHYADDGNLYTAIRCDSGKVNDSSAITHIESCTTSALAQWYAAHGMQLNPMKSEDLLLATHAQSQNMPI